MPTPTTYPSAKQFVNLAKETTQGTPVETGQKTYPFTEFKPKDDPVMLADEGLRGSMVKTYGKIQGPQKSAFTGAGAVFLDLLPHLLLNLMGAVASTGPVSSIYTHIASLLNSGTGQPPSHTFTDFQGLTATSGARSYAGGSLSELTLKGNPESTLIEMAIKGSAFWSNAFPTAPPTVDLPAENPMAAWRVELAFGGALPGSKNLTVREWEITTTREISVQHTSQNSQAPYIIQRGPIQTMFKFFVAKPSDETFLTYLRDNTQPQFQLLVSNGLAAANARTLQIDMTALAFDSVEINRGDAAVGYDVSGEAVANTTDAGASGGYAPVKYTVTNAIASY
jgi:hypothetical protein